MKNEINKEDTDRQIENLPNEIFDKMINAKQTSIVQLKVWL